MQCSIQISAAVYKYASIQIHELYKYMYEVYKYDRTEVFPIGFLIRLILETWQHVPPQEECSQPPFWGEDFCSVSGNGASVHFESLALRLFTPRIA